MDFVRKDAARSFWTGRRVLICGVTDAFGAALAETLAELGADVNGIVGSSPKDESAFIQNRIYERVRPVRAKELHAQPIAAIMAANEIECTIDASLNNPHATYSLLSAARIGRPDSAVVIAIPNAITTHPAMINRFRSESSNLISLAVIPDQYDQAVDWVLEIAERTMKRDLSVLNSINEREKLRAA